MQAAVQTQVRSLIPPSQRVDIEAVFISPEFAATREKALNYLFSIYQSHGDPGEKIWRENFITEHYFLAMPTQAAYKAELGLCLAIVQHSRGAADDLEIREVLKLYLDTHTFVYYPDGNRTVKAGEFREWTEGIEAFYVPDLGVLNLFQVKLFEYFNLKSGNTRRLQISKLQ